MMSRRTFGRAAVGLLLGSSARTAVAATSAAPRLAISDVSNDVSTDLRQAEDRFAIYRDIGVSLLRTAVGWSDFEHEKGVWALRPARLRYLERAARSGLSLKLEIGAMASAPGWFFDDHPDAHLRNPNGRSPPQLLSVWFPGAASLICEKQARMVASLKELGVLDHVGAVIAQLGPSGEPIYPAPWQVGGDPRLAFWFYDVHAQRDFGTRMQQHFAGDVTAANRRWGARYREFADVPVAEPGTVRGPAWEDVLLWYRDSKRRVIEPVLRDMQAQIGRLAPPDTPVILLVPGNHTDPEKWRQAIAAGDGVPSIKVMTDTDHLLDLAAETRVSLQHTAAQNEPEIRYLLTGLRARNVSVPVWAENAGGPPALDPEHLADVVLRNALQGLDYIGAAVLFAADRMTPSPMFPRVRAAMARIAGAA